MLKRFQFFISKFRIFDVLKQIKYSLFFVLFCKIVKLNYFISGPKFYFSSSCHFDFSKLLLFPVADLDNNNNDDNDDDNNNNNSNDNNNDDDDDKLTASKSGHQKKSRWRLKLHLLQLLDLNLLLSSLFYFFCCCRLLIGVGLF